VIAFYLPCSYYDNPKVGEFTAKIFNISKGYIINIGLPSNFVDYATLDDKDKPYRGAEIIGAIFWQIRAGMDHLTADKFLASAWEEFANVDHPHTVVEFLKVYQKQFQAGDAAKYRDVVNAAFRDHHVDLSSN